jgi:hypothetical protein
MGRITMLGTMRLLLSLKRIKEQRLSRDKILSIYWLSNTVHNLIIRIYLFNLTQRKEAT